MCEGIGATGRGENQKADLGIKEGGEKTALGGGDNYSEFALRANLNNTKGSFLIGILCRE